MRIGHGQKHKHPVRSSNPNRNDPFSHTNVDTAVLYPSTTAIAANFSVVFVVVVVVVVIAVAVVLVFFFFFVCELPPSSSSLLLLLLFFFFFYFPCLYLPIA